MPSYTFHCKECGEFTLFFKSSTGNRATAECPSCLLESKRVFFPPNLFSYSKEIRTRIEKGMEPRRMTREELGTTPRKNPKPSGRPWQL